MSVPRVPCTECGKAVKRWQAVPYLRHVDAVTIDYACRACFYRWVPEFMRAPQDSPR